MHDCDGHALSIGANVLLLRIDPLVLEALPPDEREDVASMLDDELIVYDLRAPFVCVEKRWERGGGMVEYHMLSVPAADLRVVK
jgi:hypothetical protein